MKSDDPETLKSLDIHVFFHRVAEELPIALL
jgi:hypothetical protein